MATKVVSRLPITSARPTAAIRPNTRRTFVTSQRPLAISLHTTPKPLFLRPALQQSFRRSYADQISPVARRKRAGFFRWTWRLVQLSAVAGVATLTYTIYVLRTPQEQLSPDPSKKTLVILGRHPATAF